MYHALECSSLIMELRQVKIQEAQFRTHMGKDLSYDEYCSLLFSAAQQYDAQIGNNGPKMAKTRVYKHEIFDIKHNKYFADSHDIDLPIAGLHVNAAKFQGGPRLSYKQWHALPDDTKKIWDILSPKVMTIILHPFSVR